MSKPLSMTVLIGLLVSAIAISGAECQPGAISSKVNNGQLVILNNSGKPIVAYVLVDNATKSGDGSPARTFSGVFTGDDSLKPNAAMEIGESSGRSEIAIDYLRFADGSVCGPEATAAAKRVAARFASGAPK